MTDTWVSNGWVLHSGCIPCSFVCDSCSKHKYRCMSGEDMYVLDRKNAYGEGSKYLCSDCYEYRNCPCPTLKDCKCAESPAPVEVDFETGSRKTYNGCSNCYYHFFPCPNHCDCDESSLKIITFEEFVSVSGRFFDYPGTYEEFLKESPRPIRE